MDGLLIDSENDISGLEPQQLVKASRSNFRNAQQKSYNEILVERAAAFNDQATSTGVEVVAEYQGEAVESVGTYAFGASDINGGDCFHPSISGQNELSRIIWQNNPFK
jgi:hypothetical protein